MGEALATAEAVSDLVLPQSGLTRLVEAAGFSIRESKDFTGFVEAHGRLRKAPVTPIFDPARQPVEGFWQAVRDSAGELCGIQAVVHAGEAWPSLWAHLIERREAYQPTGLGVDPARSEIPSSVARTVDGQVCYHGEFFLLPRVQGQGLAPILIRLIQVLAWQAWRPDLFFGLSHPDTSSAHFARAMGYAGFEPDAAIWRDALGRAVQVEGLVWSGPARLRELTEQGSDEMRAFARRRSAEKG